MNKVDENHPRTIREIAHQSWCDGPLGWVDNYWNGRHPEGIDQYYCRRSLTRSYTKLQTRTAKVLGIELGVFGTYP